MLAGCAIWVPGGGSDQQAVAAVASAPCRGLELPSWRASSLRWKREEFECVFEGATDSEEAGLLRRFRAMCGRGGQGRVYDTASMSYAAAAAAAVA